MTTLLFFFRFEAKEIFVYEKVNEIFILMNVETNQTRHIQANNTKVEERKNVVIVKEEYLEEEEDLKEI